MDVTVLYFDGCPNFELARHRVEDALDRIGERGPVVLQEVASLEDAERLGFSGSPTVLIDGEDRFPGAGRVAMACRLYGDDHAPSVDAIVEALNR